MNKNIVTLGIIGAIISTLAISTATFAEPVPTSNEPNHPVTTSDNAEQPESNCVGNPNANCGEVVQVNPGNEISEPGDDDVTESINLEGTTGSGIDQEATEVDCELTPDAELCAETETPYWPMYLSLGALGLAILVFIILNLFGRKPKK